MLYLGDQDLSAMGTDYAELVGVIRDAVLCLDAQDFAQPMKPYLRYRDKTNRIIAMPAFLGGKFDVAGIKWIASFPGNIEKGIPRAHSVVILNDAANGAPIAIINTPRLSVIRTAAVSGLMLRSYLQHRPVQNARVGIVGWGPIGRAHYECLAHLLGPKMAKCSVFDIRSDVIDADRERFSNVEFVQSWQDAYDGADVFVTSTVSKQRYIDRPAKPGSLLLNVSLRDFTSAILPSVRGGVVVDDWTEVCREGTDIEMFHKEHGLTEAEACTLAQVIARDALSGVPASSAVMFNPMGMAVFDVATATHVVRACRAKGIGTSLA